MDFLDREWGRRHGGVHQRLSADDPDTSDVNGVARCSRLVMTLLIEWAWVFLSAVAVQRISEAAVDDGISNPIMQKLASIGCHGVYPANCQRDIMSKFRIPKTDIPEPLIVKLPLLNVKKVPPEVEEVDFPIFLVQDMLHCLYHSHPREFKQRYIGSENALSEFWSGVRGDDPRIVHHPVRLRPGYKDYAIPERLHGDGVPYGQGEDASLDVVSHSSMVASGDIIDTIMLY